MKLVDILARELKAWPEGVCAIEQDRRGSRLYEVGRAALREYVDECADDSDTAQVTRAQWQAAVDKLKAEVHTTESMALHHQEVGRITRQWNGEGLPPVGTVCEAKTTRGWSSGTIIAHGLQPKENLAVWQEDGELIFWGVKEYFRPIRTTEQIAEGEIQKIRDEIKWKKPQLGPCPVEQMYLLGYRKFEIVDN